MELPLSITALQSLFVLHFLKKLEPASITELCWQMRPYIVLHQVRLTDSAFQFSSGLSIDYSDVIAFAVKQGTLKILCGNGCLYLLSGSCSKHIGVQICSPELYKESGKMQSAKDNLKGSIRLSWWYIKESMSKKLL